MKKVLLISNFVYHYRINNYDYFHKVFKKDGIEFQVLANNMQPVEFDFTVPIKIKKPGILAYIKYIREQKPDCIIIFLHLKDLIIFPIVFYCRFVKIPIVYWNFGIDLFDPDATVKNILYKKLHSLCDAILLYSPNEKIYVHPRHHNKTFIANNSVNLTDFDHISFSGNYLKDHFHIKERYIVLFAGSLTTRKRVNELLQCFRNHDDIAVVLVGNAVTNEMLEIIANTTNYYYLGVIAYNKIQMAKIYHSADIVCIPGNVGLAIIDSFFWGKPIVTIKPPARFNSPELWYLRNNENGYIVEDVKELESKITRLLNDADLYQEFSKKAKETAMNESHISRMYEGFKSAIEYLIYHG